MGRSPRRLTMMHVQIYDKGHDKAPHGITHPRVRVTPLRNAGREGRTWLEHFRLHYDRLPRVVYLSQGDPHQTPEEFRRRLEVERPRMLAGQDTTSLTREYMPHFPPRWKKDRDVVEWHDGIEVRYGRAIYQGLGSEAENAPWLRRVWPHFFTCPIPDPLSEWTYGYGAMYAVPRHRITDRPLAFWDWCWDVIARPEHQEEHSWGSGYAFEILWRYLLGDAAKYPVRMPPTTEREVDRNRLLATECRHSDGSCGCGGRPRACSHPLQVPTVNLAAHCLDCPFKALKGD